MFWNDEVKHYEYPFLRSSNAGNYEGAFGVFGNNGHLGNRTVTNSSVVRPALNLNLSQIDFSIVS